LPAELLDGKAIAQRVRQRVASETAELTARGVRPGIAVVLVGNDPASEVYVRSKGRASEEAGMHSVTLTLPAETSHEELLAHVTRLNGDPAIHGILVQMPLPPQIHADAIIHAIAPEKDVDGFHPVNVGKLLAGDESGFVPCTPAGVQVMLAEAGVETSGAECVIVGRSNIVGKPMAALMMQQRKGGNATVTVCHSRTRDLAAHARRADILIAATGKPGLISGDMVRSGAVVIDVGINRIRDDSTKSGWRLVGDVDFAAAREVASLITPVPGGVGPMTIAMLLHNTVRAARRTLS
jgi:methylenetetrahydrofolate dehydrogenase (NADP+) / methenyltetrahydrofolate cyclohydrolase